jgi:hypothetical protein
MLKVHKDFSLYDVKAKKKCERYESWWKHTHLHTSLHTHTPACTFFGIKIQHKNVERQQIGKTICNIYDRQKVIFFIY